MDVVAVVIVIGALTPARQQRRRCPSIAARWDPSIVLDLGWKCRLHVGDKAKCRLFLS